MLALSPTEAPYHLAQLVELYDIIRTLNAFRGRPNDELNPLRTRRVELLKSMPQNLFQLSETYRRYPDVLKEHQLRYECRLCCSTRKIERYSPDGKSLVATICANCDTVLVLNIGGTK